jgi:hypothetical protein
LREKKKQKFHTNLFQFKLSPKVCPVIIKIMHSTNILLLENVLDQEQDSETSKPTANEMPKPTKEIQASSKGVDAATATASTGSKQSKEPNPYEHFMEEAHLTSLKIRQEKEAEIQRVQEHWRTQLLNLTEHVRNG